MKGISYKDLTNDLSNILISFIEPLNLKFLLSYEEITLKELFAKSGLMPLFLYDKQSFINTQLQNKTVNKSNTPAFAKLHFHLNSDSILTFKIDIVHNLLNTNDFINEKPNDIYETLLYDLASQILNEKIFFILDNKIILDKKYDIFISQFKNFFFNQFLN